MAGYRATESKTEDSKIIRFGGGSYKIPLTFLCFFTFFFILFLLLLFPFFFKKKKEIGNAEALFRKRKEYH
jgi:hypothetical protein